MKLARGRCLAWIAVLGLAVGARAAAQEPLPPAAAPAAPPSAHSFDALDAGRDAYQMAEAERRQATARQVQMVDDMVWYSAAPSYRCPLALEFSYAHPRAWRARIGPVVVSAGPAVFGHHASLEALGSATVGPWGIYGYPHVERAAQPLGHRVIVTGPNGYVYRPVYPWDLKSPPPAPPPVQPAPPAPAQPAEPPPPEPIPAPPAESGPREF